MLEEVGIMIELAAEEAEGPERDMAMAEAERTLGETLTEFDRLELQSLLCGELDGNNAYLTLHAGAGGTESCDWADMLYRMFKRFAERSGFDVEIIDLSPGDEAGLKSVTMLLSGPNAYGYLKSERGVHRLVRISPYDSAKRRHTSFAALDVVAEINDDIDVEIKTEDVRVDTFRSSGAGGQHVNTTDSAVRITHMPSGIVVACQAERSQHKNRAKAEKLLKAKLYEWLLDQKRKDMEKFYSDKGDIAWGSQIRSYVMQPYTMVKDHRTSHETSNVSAVLDGDIQSFLDAFLKWNATQTASTVESESKA
ncbi:MAG: peptide chain release factor 2 [Candidatus Promineifilaceae bacterium]|jgi:peptide chain release factor 2